MRYSTLAVLATLVACQSASPPTEESPAVRVENPELGIALAAMVEEFELTTNEGARLELARTGDKTGTAWFEVGPPSEAGINLVEVVNSQKADYESLPNGSFSGSREMMMTDGRSAYYSRGQFDDGDVRVEEFRVSALHPTENRLLRVFYRYPLAEDSADRLNDLLLLIGEIEATGPADAAETAE